MKKYAVICGVLLLQLICGCSDNKDVVVYYKFKDHTWQRFDPVKFEITVNPAEENYDVILFAHYTREFDFDNLGFNMIMTTPSGEERIKEYQVEIKSKSGSFLGQCNNDSCEVFVPLKKEIKLTKGVLKLEFENLIPRLQTRGLLGIGIKLHPRR